MSSRIRWLDMVVYFAFLVLALRTGHRTLPWYVGLGLVIVCAPLWIVARRQLGESFSLRPEARRLVTHGLYSKFRHPVYVFGGLAWLGVLLVLLGWPAIVFWLIVVLIEVRRARGEERVLADTFGAEYEAYRRRTWF